MFSNKMVGSKDDVESGSDGDRTKGRKKQPSEEVYARMKPNAQHYWERTRGLEPVCPWDGPFHAHGVLAASRFVLEKRGAQEALLMGTGMVVDVGAAPKRTAPLLGLRGRYLVPELQVGDARRWRETPAELKGTDRICRCRVEMCEHLRPSDVLLFVHSAYYVDPLTLWKIMRNAAGAFVVGHHFESAFGGLLDECTYELDGTCVTMQVNGNSEPYRHAMLPWNYGWRGPDGERFDVSEIDRVGSFSRLWEVSASFGEAVRPLEIGEVFAEADLQGPVQFADAARAKSAVHGRSTEFEIDLDRVYRLGPVFVTDAAFGGSRRRTTLPVSLVSDAAAYMVGKTRDSDGWLNLRHFVTEKAARMNIPAQRRAEVVTLATALGFTVGLETETDVLHTIQRRFGPWFTLYNSLLVFQPRKIYALWGVVITLVLLSVVWLSVEVLDDDTAVRGWALLLFIAAAATLFCCLACVRQVTRAHSMGASRSWNLSMRAPTPASQLSSAAVPLLGADRAVPGTERVRPPLEDVEGSLRLTEPREKYIGRANSDKPRIIASGIGFANAVPVAFATTQAVEHSGVSLRIMRPKPAFQRAQVERLWDWFDDSPLLPRGYKVGRGTIAFERWVATLKGKYSATYVAEMASLKESFLAEAEATIEAGRPFLKIEKSYVVGVEGGEASKPRLIQPPVRDITKVVTGVFSSQMYRAVAQKWNGVDSPILYASGMTTDAIGAAVDKFIDGHPNFRAYKNDFSGYDALLSIFLQHGGFEYYRECDVPSWAVGHYTAVRTRGRTPTGVEFAPRRRVECVDEGERDWLTRILVKYELDHKVDGLVVDFEDFQMCSGRGDTNLMDTLVNACTFAVPLEAEPTTEWLLLVNGDDAFLLYESLDPDRTIASIRAFQRGLGLDADGDVCGDRSEWEFCSKLFWWGIDPKTKEAQTVLGPKPGRSLSRSGWNTTVAGTQNAAGAAQSLRRDAGHVPFVRVLAERTFVLCRNARIRPVGREEYGLKASHSYEMDPRNWALCESRYSLDEASEAQLRDQLSAVHTVPVLVTWEPIERMVEVDA